MTTLQERVTVRLGDHDSPVEVLGRGRVVLYLHAEVEGSRPTRSVEALADDRRVLVPTHPGFGNSPRPVWLENVHDLVLHYAEMLGVLGIDEVDLIGASLGGWVALAFASTYPEKVRSLVVAGSVGTRLKGVSMPNVFRLGPAAMLRTAFHAPSRIPDDIWSGGNVEQQLRCYHDMTAFARLTWVPYMFDPQLARWLWRVRMPTLVVWGANDAITPPEHGVALCDRLEHATLSLVDNCGHYPLLEQPEQVTSALRDFIDSCAEVVG